MVSPTNVINFFRDDIFSEKMGPLLFDAIKRESNPLRKHQLALLIIHERPTNWKKHVENYMFEIDKNSFYLFDSVQALKAQLKYSFLSNDDRSYATYLLKLGFAKHETGSNRPSISQIKEIQFKTIDPSEKIP